MLSPRLQLKVAQKQILTPGLVQMVTVLQLNRLELKEMINQEIVENPVLEETTDEGEEITPEELQPLLEAERSADPADQSLLDAAEIKLDGEAPEVSRNGDNFADVEAAAEGTPTVPPKPSKPPPPTPSMRSISDPSLTTISIPAIAAPRPNRSTSLLSRLSFRSPRLCPITCARSSV